MVEQRAVAWFSCGAASAYATYLAAKKYENLKIVYCHVQQEHPSNLIFLEEFQRKTNLSIEVITSEKYGGDIFNVFLQRGFIKNTKGAPCTYYLKKELRKKYQQAGDIQIFGYTAEEVERRNNFEDANPEVHLDNILIDLQLTKAACLRWLVDRGFSIPVMYRLGYSNNNCIGCVKGGMGYWNAIRKDFPERFAEMAKIERLVGHAVNKDKNGPVFLDELEPGRGNFKRDQPGACGFACEWQEDLFYNQLKREDGKN